MILQAITKDGAISADYTLVIVIGVCGFLIISIASFAFYTINKNLENMRADFNNSIASMGKDFSEFRKDFHKFVEMQSGLNATFKEKTKDL